MKDIETRADIELLVNEFYKQVVADKTIGHIFTEVAQFSWEVHIPTMYNFWETILLGNPAYKGNAIVKHIELNKLVPLQKHHFDTWLTIWQNTVSHFFSGQKASEAISRAKSIADVMQFKVYKGEMGIAINKK